MWVSRNVPPPTSIYQPGHWEFDLGIIVGPYSFFSFLLCSVFEIFQICVREILCPTPSKFSLLCVLLWPFAWASFFPPLHLLATPRSYYSSWKLCQAWLHPPYLYVFSPLSFDFPIVDLSPLSSFCDTNIVISNNYLPSTQQTERIPQELLQFEDVPYCQPGPSWLLSELSTPLPKIPQPLPPLIWVVLPPLSDVGSACRRTGGGTGTSLNGDMKHF